MSRAEFFPRVFTELNTLQNQTKVQFYYKDRFPDELLGSETAKDLVASIQKEATYSAVEIDPRSSITAPVSYYLDRAPGASPNYPTDDFVGGTEAGTRVILVQGTATPQVSCVTVTYRTV